MKADLEMSNISRFFNRTGLSNDFFESYKLVHHAVEAPIEMVSSTLIDAERFFSVKHGQGLKLQSDVFGQACEISDLSADDLVRMDVIRVEHV